MTAYSQRAELYSGGNLVGSNQPATWSQPEEAGGQPAAMDPDAVQVCQYTQGQTDATSYNDCGVACVLMVIRAMGLQAAFDAKVAAWKDVATTTKVPVTGVTIQKELDYVRHCGGLHLRADAAGHTAALSLPDVHRCLVGVLTDLGVAKDQIDHAIDMVNASGGGTAKAETANVTSYLAAHCTGGTAVIVLGAAKAAPWGWGGTHAEAGKRSVGDLGGGHFVVVWRESADEPTYTVLDPAWMTPRRGIAPADVAKFVSAFGSNVHMMAVAFSEVAHLAGGTGARDHGWAAHWAEDAGPPKVPDMPMQEGGKAAMDPDSAQVCQYDADTTDAAAMNGCGPACVIMIVRAMGLRDAFEKQVKDWNDQYKGTKDTAKYTANGTAVLQKQLDYVRWLGGSGGNVYWSPRVDDAGHDAALSPTGLVTCLTNTLVALHVPDKEIESQVQLYTAQTQADLKPQPHVPSADMQKKVKDYLAQHCGEGSAVIVLGSGQRAPWKWGGQNSDDKEAPKHTLPDLGGHFIVVWREHGTDKTYRILDPSWHAPRPDIYDEVAVATFCSEYDSILNMIAVPFAYLASKIGTQAADAVGPKKTETTLLPEAPKHDDQATGATPVQQLANLGSAATAIRDQLLAEHPAIDAQQAKASLGGFASRIRELSEGVKDPAIEDAAARASDAVVAAYQALAVHFGDDTARRWASDPAVGKAMTAAMKKATQADPPDYCGEFVKEQYESAGLETLFPFIFESTDDVLGFFSYNVGWNSERVPNFIAPRDTGAWQTVRAYHEARQSPRRCYTHEKYKPDELRAMMRPGDVATLYNGTAQVASHVVMIKKVDASSGTIVTLEGNTYIVRPDHEPGHSVDEGFGIGINKWQPDGKGGYEDKNWLAQQDPNGLHHAQVFMIGRPSMVDFEAGHKYALRAPGAPTGPRRSSPTPSAE